MASRSLTDTTERMVNNMYNQTYEHYKEVEMLQLDNKNMNENLLAYQYLVESLTQRIIRLEKEINKLEMM
jgi:predicted  nucleic acid-binding Zn-ribbon protein